MKVSPDESPEPVERPPVQPGEQAPQREGQANTFVLAILVVALVVILASGAVLGYKLWRRSHESQIATAQIVSPSHPTLSPALSSKIATPPAAPAPPISEPSVHYVKTPWGTRCQISADQIVCDTCEPGLVLDTPAGAECPGPSLNEIAADSSGVKQTPNAGVILPVSPDVQQLSEGQAYDISGWTISVGGWVRFTNNSTGHGMAVAAQNLDFF